MDWLKVLQSGGKFFLVTIISIIVAVMAAGLSGYKPGSPLEVVLAQYAVVPLITAILGALQNLIKHLGDK